MPDKPKVPLIALILAVLFGLTCLVVASRFVLESHSAPDEFGEVTPDYENALAWIVVAIGAIILLAALAMLLREIERRIKGMR